MNALANFVFEEHLVRVVDIAGEPWFAGKDVCAALDIRDHHQALDRLDPDEKGGYEIPTQSASRRGGGDRSMIVVSLPGVFRLIGRSNKPEAKRFMRWVYHEVLPSILRTGGYGRQAGAGTPAEIPDLDIQRQRIALDIVKEARMTWDRAFVREIWEMVGLPTRPKALPDTGPVECLRWLLAYVTAKGSVRELLDRHFAGDWKAREALAEATSIKANEEGMLIPNVSPKLHAVFAGTPFHRHFEFLRRLPGAEPHNPRGGGNARTMTFLPSTVLDL
ncbi:MAG: hypothetical protein KIS96_14505 [Bauldia sp.]|nr:hypothetical protein [Bauldia sp.]